MKFKKLFTAQVCLFAITLFIGPNLFAQTKARLTGTVTDSSGKPLQFVTVRFHKQKDPANPLQTTYTKEGGTYSLNKIDTGRYILMFSHTGFAEQKQPIHIKPDDREVVINPVQLTLAAGTLKEVTIKTVKPLIEQADDKIIYNVEDDPTSKSETAIDILRKTPFVTVDGEDNIQVNGQRNFKVLLNGRETSMFARNIKEALRGFPGAMISKIEVITSPSAKYDGEGVGGVLNIITKKKVIGYNGTISSFSRTLDNLNVFSINGNAKFGKIGMTLFLNKGERNPRKQESSSFTIPSNPVAFSKRSLQGLQRNSNGWTNGNAEISMELDSLNTISTYGNINSGSDRSRQEQTITTEFISSPATTSYLTLESENEYPGVSVGTDYIRKFKKQKEKEFSLKLFGEFGKNNSDLNSQQVNPGTDRFLINNSRAHNNQYTVQTDYIHPFKNKTRLESGVKAILRRASSDFRSMVKYDQSHEFKINPSNTDYFKYRQDVFSAYSMYSFKSKKTNFRVGGRIEHTTVNGDFISSHTLVSQRYTTFLPNVQATTKLNQTLTMVHNYSKRLSRPYIWDLNPFVFNNDSLNITFGNPDLGPQTTHSFSSQLRYMKGTTFAGITLEASYSGNKILDYSFYDPQTGVTKTTALNIGKEFHARLQANLNTKFTENWNFFMNIAVRYIDIENNGITGQSNRGFGGHLNMNSSYRFTKKFTVSGYLGLWQEPVTIQTSYPFSTWYNVAFNHKFFKDKFNVSLRAVNFLEKTWDFRTKTRDPNFYSENVVTQFRRGFVMALTWNFGKLSENVSKKKGVSNDDLLSKPQPQTTN